MKKSFFISLCLIFMAASVSFAFTPGTYEGKGKGYSETSPVVVKVTVDEKAITNAEIEAPEEVPFGVQNLETYSKALIGRTDGNIDAVSNATMTRNGVAEAVEKALAQARGGEDKNALPLSFTPGEYTAAAPGYNGPVTVKVKFDAEKILEIEILNHSETAHVGDIAFEIMIPEMIQANGSGVDAVSGATMTSTAAKKAVETVYVQCFGYEITTDDIKAKVAEAIGKKTVKELNIYVKPEEGMIYYTADGEQGSVNI